MTEAKWLTCTDPGPMLAFLRGKRKLRLYAVACCRHLIPLLLDSQAWGVVEAAEQFADGKIGRRRLQAIWNPFVQQGFPCSNFSPDSYARGAVNELIGRYCLKHRPRPTAMTDVVSAVVEASCKWWNFWQRRKIRTAERKAQCQFLRDITRNPFHPVAVDATWLTPAVVSLAHAIYDDRAFDRLPDLATALEEAACNNPEILAHFRGPGPHVRGCWALDLVLGKE